MIAAKTMGANVMSPGTSERDSRSGRAIEGRKAILGCEKQMFGAEQQVRDRGRGD